MKNPFFAPRYILLVLGFLGTLLIGYFYVLPRAAEWMASKVSIGTERKMGDAAYAALQAVEDSAGTSLITDFYDALAISTPYEIRIVMVRDTALNAFALPGGQIVVNSGLVKKMQSYPELAALLAHETIHVQERHATRSLFRSMGSQLVIHFLFGDMGSVVSTAAIQAEEIRSLSYSRKLEKEADLKGLLLLTKRSIDAQGFIDLLNHLRAEDGQLVLPEFISSHPDIASRISYIRQAARGQSASGDTTLKSIFEKLKKHIYDHYHY